MRSLVSLAPVLLLCTHAVHHHSEHLNPWNLSLVRGELDSEAALHRRVVDELLLDAADFVEGPKGTDCEKPIDGVTNDMGGSPSLICKSKRSKVQIWRRGKHERILSTGGRTTAGKVFCVETCQGCKVSRSDLHECPPCPCTVMHLTEHLYSYFPPLYERVRRQCTGNPHFNVFHVGLGSGSSVHAVNTICSTQVVRIVEYQADAIFLSTNFLGLRAKWVDPARMTTDPGIEVVTGDGEAVSLLMAKNMPQMFDRIIIDCMNNGYIPEGCRSSKLYASLKKLLRPTGVLSQWTWVDQIDEIAATMKDQFGNSEKEAGWVHAHLKH